MKQGWEIKKLVEVCYFQNGFAFKSNTFTDRGEPILRISDIQNDEIIESKMVFFNPKSYPEDLSRFLVYPNDIVIAMSGGTTGKIGINKTNKTFYLNQRVGVFRENPNLLNHQYLYYFLKTKSEESLNLAAGAAQPNLSTVQINAFEIPTPSLAEQERIVGILDKEFERIDALKANAEQNLQHAKDLFQSALKQELQPKEGWKKRELQNIAEICLGLTHTPKYVSNGIPFVSVKDISGGELNLLSTKRISVEEFDTFPYGAKPQVGDVLFCRVGTIGKPLILRENKPFGIFVSVGFLRPDKDIVTSETLRYWMLSPMFEQQVRDNVVGSTLKNLNTGWLKKFVIYLPTIEAQNIVVHKLDSVEKHCKALEENYKKTIALCDDMKQALLRKAFNGEL